MLYLKFLIIYFILFSLVFFVSKYFNWVDEPNSRKIHDNPIYNTGGLIIYLFYLIIVSQFELNHNIELIITTGFFVILGGFVDDRKNIRPLTKLIIIFIPSIYLLGNGIIINDLGNYDYVGLINLGKFSIPFLILSIGLLINATNYIDGVDGLLLSFFFSTLVYYIFLVENVELQNLLLLLSIPVFFNFILNIIPSRSGFKFFTGDNGSLFIGFFISFLTINLYKEFNVHPAYLIWPLWYPVYDFLFVSINRLLKNQSLLKPDKSHMHHYIFQILKKNHILTTFLFIISNTTILILSLQLTDYSKFISLIIFGLSFILYSLIRFKINNRF